MHLAVAAARATGAILLSCDSMKVYRGMDAGTAKPSASAREGVDWRGLDLVDPWESYDANRFRGLFEEVLGEARERGRPLVLAGGTMLYLKAATEGLGETPPRDEALREALTARAELEGTGALHRELARCDPDAAGRIHPNDLRRLVRALEVHARSGRPLSSFQGQFGQVRPDLDRVVLVVQRERDDMKRRIDARVARMVRAGWIEECERLRADPRGISAEARQALGYRQLLDWLEAGRAEPLDHVVARIQTGTRRFARRQLTWLRHVAGAQVLEVAPDQEPTRHLELALAAIEGR